MAAVLKGEVCPGLANGCRRIAGVSMKRKEVGLRRCWSLVGFMILFAVSGTIGCEDGGIFGPSTSVGGTWQGTFVFGRGAAEVTAILSDTGEDQIEGSFTGIRSNGPAATSDVDGGSVTGHVVWESEWPTAVVTFESLKYCSWTFSAVLDGDTMAGTWSTVPGCGTPSSGSATLTRS